jgi:hypothetical protein
MAENNQSSFEPLLTEEEAKKVLRGPLPPGDYYLFGSDACVEGAIFAGCRYYAGYPITPASEIMEKAAQRLPQVGGRFIQMEDEISSACSLIGASWAGVKAMTATSGPGFSLMMEARAGPGIHYFLPGGRHAGSLGAPRRRISHRPGAIFRAGDVRLHHPGL